MNTTHPSTGLSDLFTCANGTRIATPAEWPARRAELQEAILQIQYGHLPPAPETFTIYPLGSFAVSRADDVHGTHFKLTATHGVGLVVSLILPPGNGPFPVIVDGDGCWRYLTNEILTAIALRGYAVALFNRVEIVPDVKTSARDYGLYTAFPEGDFGALAAWAWGYHRVVDFLQTRGEIDPTRIAATGHSRGGKTALLAGATDERIALTAPNDSGCGGAGCYRFPDDGGERLDDLLRNFPYWFSSRLPDYLGREHDLPFDQHSLKALVAPRALLTTEALGDIWASPRGTYRTYLAAREVYGFLGVEEKIGIWYREGGHAHTLPDWQALLDFADWQFYGKPPVRNFHPNPWV